jgi:hypothetical protein
MILNQRKRFLRLFNPILRAMMKIKRGSMIDQPQLPVPDQHIGILGGAVYIHEHAVEPHDHRSYVGFHCIDCWIITNRSGEITDPEVEPYTKLEQILNFLIALHASEPFVQVSKHKFRHAQAQCPSDFATEQFCDECLGPLPCASELEHIEELIISFGDGGQ